ncbi:MULTISPECIES: hypothetical protein [Arenibacter]|uniref:hypothetical protein n=1 Tax=Arenibacter TaxID=178469 RepID=UPI001CC7F88B|nr:MULTISPECIES: hypothetical protein [Arenibacter]
MKKLLVFAFIIGVLGCSSVEMVENYKNPDIVLFDAYKVLIVGMTDNAEVRKDFETRFKKEFDKRGIEAMRSIDLFDVAFTNTKKTEEELDQLEEQLLDKGFDAIMFSKVSGSENKQTFRKTMSELQSFYGGFKDDYLGSQGVFYDRDYYDQFKVYHAETSLYCICVDKERALIWRGAIDITDPKKIDKTLEDYIKLVVRAMEEQDLIFRNK